MYLDSAEDRRSDGQPLDGSQARTTPLAFAARASCRR